MFQKLLFFFVLAGFITLPAQDLPRYMTDKEKELMKTYQFPSIETGFTTPPEFTARTMAEWEELEGIMITWTSFQSILAQIVDYAQEEGKIFIVCTDSNAVKSYLTSQNIPLVNLVYLEESFNSIWCRDYGPWTIYKDYTDQKSYVDWVYNRPRPSDDLIPGKIGDFQGLDVYSTTTSPYRLTNTGGNFMTDGHGTGFCSDLILEDNPSLSASQIDQIVNEFMGIDRYIKMDVLPYDAIHHIDMHMKLLDEETLLVGEYPAGVADGPQIEENLQYILDNYKTCFNRDFKVVRIPMPPDASGHYPNQGGDYRTYTNSVIVNGTVIVPTYQALYDTTALRIYREAMPGYKVVGINSNSIIPSLGAIHCITKEMGSTDPVFISHAKIREGEYNAETEVKAFVSTSSGVAEARMYWSVDTLSGFNEVVMAEIADTFYASIPAMDYGTEVYYYVEAESNSGKITRKPPVAPRGVYKFSVQEEMLTSAIEINSGWNLTSVPLVPENTSATSVFGNAASAVFGYNLTYMMVDEVEPGRAYWVKYDSPDNITLSGTRPEGNISLISDWNMIGPFNCDMAVEEIYTEPAGIITSQFYYFDGGYFPADTLKQGKGYWVKTNQAGMLIVEVPVSGKVSNTESNIIGTITVTDAAGKSQQLYVAGKNVNNVWFELPPPAPGNSMDVRFEDNLSIISSDETKTLKLNNAVYPVQIITDLNNLVVNGKNVSADGLVLKDGNSPLFAFESLPEEFSLGQNYPNPFNPETKITFTLPVKSRFTFSVYNTLGQKVFETAQNEANAGIQDVYFNGSGFSSGVYIYTLSTKGIDGSSHSATRKMILMK